ncbi:MAG: hypothetical protein C0603_00120 [Denitrovibrio sp.]|nr:MAG: hypothetical protein C0603_00120 [Denitrovibrio sp.]
MKVILKLFRPKVSLMVGLSTFAGASLFDSGLNLFHLYAILSAVSLSAGCSALNQFQESERDNMMDRTKNRPIPMGSIKPFEAIRFAILFISLSVAFMLMTDSHTGIFLILITVVVYNFIYTPLKKRTPFALLIGAVTGAIPPMLGYTALGGSLLHMDIILVSAVLYVWQTPHFAILAERYAVDYKKAGFHTLSSVYGQFKTHIFIRIWLAAFICSLFLLPVAKIYCNTNSSYVHTGLTATSALLILIFIKKPIKTFHILNLCMVLFFLLLVVDRIII